MVFLLTDDPFTLWQSPATSGASPCMFVPMQ
jgi:hypothetical protein